MKQYVIDELRLNDYHRLKEHLDRNFERGPLEGVYWLPIDPDVLTPEQARHTDCHPLCFALSLEEDRLCCELLVRTRNRARCDCMAYATRSQRDWLMDRVDALAASLELFT